MDDVVVRVRARNELVEWAPHVALIRDRLIVGDRLGRRTVGVDSRQTADASDCQHQPDGLLSAAGDYPLMLRHSCAEMICFARKLHNLTVVSAVQAVSLIRFSGSTPVWQGNLMFKTG